jgi:hypothetical protein
MLFVENRHYTATSQNQTDATCLGVWLWLWLFLKVFSLRNVSKQYFFYFLKIIFDISTSK